MRAASRLYSIFQVLQRVRQQGPNFLWTLMSWRLGRMFFKMGPRFGSKSRLDINMMGGRVTSVSIALSQHVDPRGGDKTA